MSGPVLERRRTRDERHVLRAGDGLPLTLIRVRGAEAPTKGPVLLVHGAGVRAELFRPPVERTISIQQVSGAANNQRRYSSITCIVSN